MWKAERPCSRGRPRAEPARGDVDGSRRGLHCRPRGSPMSDASLTTELDRDGTLSVRLAGSVVLRGRRLAVAHLLAEIASGRVQRVRFADGGIDEWDSALLVLVRRVAAECEERKVTVDHGALPE